MLTALWTASTGMEAQMTNLDVIANNLANASTSGFKKSRADFQDLLYQTLEAAGSTTGPDSLSPSGQQIGVGTKLAAITKEFKAGPLARTDKELDIAIKGKGFLVVTGPDGNEAYTRDGALHIDHSGRLTNADGYAVAGLGTIPGNARGVNFSATGQVSYLDAENNENVIGNLQLAMFVNPSGLDARGGNLYAETPASGASQLSSPGVDGTGTIIQGSLEQSNVSVVEEMVSLIAAQRAYEINSKMIKASDEMLATANQIS